MKQTGRGLQVRDLCMISAGAALLAVCSWLSVPFAVPFTMQSFAVCLLPALLGRKRALLSLLIYMLLGVAGLPVFSGFRSGAGVLLGATGGYLLGFFSTMLPIGLIAEHRPEKTAALAGAMLLGMLLCYACGTAWFMIVYTRTREPIGVLSALGLCVFPFLLPDAVKCLLALVFTRRLRPLIR